MSESKLERITPAEENALRAFFINNHRGLAAGSLGISENTLKTQLASARRKLAMSDQNIVALLFPGHTGPHPKWVNPQWVIEELPTFSSLPEAGPILVPASLSGPLNDPHASFEHDQWPQPGERRNDLTKLSRLLIVICCALGLVLLLAVMFFFTDSLQRWADAIYAIKNHFN